MIGQYSSIKASKHVAHECTRWRRIRRAAHDVLSNSVVARYQSIQCAEAATLILEILKKPDEWKEHIDR